MTKSQHARAIFFGRISWHIVMALPIEWCPLWLIASAGFYAYDDGWETYQARLKT
jgi:hypothetical protein